MKKRYLKLFAGLMCFKNVQPISHYWWAIFLASRMKAILVLKDLQPNRPDKATYLANHKKKLGCGPSSQGFIYVYHTMSLVVFFSCWKWLAQFYFFKEMPKQGLLALLALLGCKSFKTRRVPFGLPRNGLYIFKTHQTGN